MDRHLSIPGTKTFRYKLDFYYQQAILYLVTLILYVGVRGTFTFDRLPSLEVDPIFYLISLFVVISFVVLLLNRLRDRRLIVTQTSFLFHQKNREREVPFDSIEWMYVGKERAVQTAGRFQVIVIKVKDRRRLFRIRVGRYERETELLAEIERIATQVPRARRPFFGMRMQ
jgi:hypothetical protein